MATEREPEAERQQHARGDELKRASPERNSTRMIAPAITPGRVPATSNPVRWLNSRRSCQKRSRPPGTAATLNNKFVGVTAGLGTCRMLSCIGNNSAAPETPAGVVTSASTNAHTAPTGHSQGTVAA